MTSTLNPACPLCGIRYENRPLLELHIREDHRQQPGRLKPGGTEAPSPAVRSSRTYDLASGPSRITKEVTAVTANTGHPRSGPLMTVLRKVIGTLRDFHDELARASEAMLRPPGVPRPRPRAQAPRSGYPHPDPASERADRAA